MTETVGASAIPATSRPTLTIPPRPQFESLFSGGTIPGFSPGPMSLVSSFFADPCPSFSQLLAGAMASPLAKPSFLMENSLREDGSGDGFEMNLGYKQNRPMSLVVGQSPFFTVPSGLSPSGFLNSPGFLSPLQSPFGMSHQQALAHVTAQAALSQSYMQTQAENACSSQGTSLQVLEREMSAELEECSFQSQLDSLPPDKQIKKFELPEVSQSENKPSFSAVDKPACDGYNWRKYGQKMVKASECPRSYYKCTHLKCPVKKKVERSVDGHISEITYKGHHNHELPQPGKRKRDGCALDVAECSKVKPELDPQGWTERNGLNGALPVHSGQVSTQMLSELPVKSGCDDIENTATVSNDRHDDEFNVKRMKTAVETNIPAPSHKTVAESKIVVQTRSEVDLLDDGFKWRKYGQKVVKGNHHPRSYYRCTFPGCNVRKHVERASTDPKSVITTYEGRHDHDTPAAGNRNHNAAKDNTLQLKQQEMATWRQLKEEQIAA